MVHHGPPADIYPYVLAQRQQIIDDGTLVLKNNLLVFSKNAEFSSPSAAAWKTADGKSLKELEEQG